MVGGTDIGLEKRRKKEPHFHRCCRKPILEKLRFTGGLWIAAGPLADREYCSECRTVFCGSFETESVQKEMDVLSVVVFSGGPDRDRLRQIP